ncbi:MAG: MBL fold metallo-hydrolase [Eubacteriales bacterium]|nr:MBL fold metallo-hydrolase [Eubacteriales bacterium]
MKITWLGHAKVVLAAAEATVLIDPFDASVGYPMDTPSADIVAISHSHHDHNDISSVPGTPEIINQPGKYRMDGVKIKAFSSFHDGQGGAQRGNNLIFVVEMDGLRICHLGDLGHLPDEELLPSLMNIDVMFVPVGGRYTIDAAEAVKLIAAARPRIAIAMHYKTDVCHVDIAPLDALTDIADVRHLAGNTLDTQDESFAQLSGIFALGYRPA